MVVKDGCQSEGEKPDGGEENNTDESRNKFRDCDGESNQMTRSMENYKFLSLFYDEKSGARHIEDSQENRPDQMGLGGKVLPLTRKTQATPASYYPPPLIDKHIGPIGRDKRSRTNPDDLHWGLEHNLAVAHTSFVPVLFLLPIGLLLLQCLMGAVASDVDWRATGNRGDAAFCYVSVWAGLLLLRIEFCDSMNRSEVGTNIVRFICIMYPYSHQFLPCFHCHPQAYIRKVQHLIERCLLLHMSRDECVKALAHHANIRPLITHTGPQYSF
ncbi:hypothetical protein SDJN02_07540, partial [Cucurbita argyrosperma subsp. argyrosperma]